MQNQSWNSMKILSALLLCATIVCVAGYCDSDPTDVSTTVVHDEGSSVPATEQDIIQQETVHVSEGKEGAHHASHDHVTSHKHPEHVPGTLHLKHCSQSSTAWKGACSRAIDGITDQNYWKHSCTHTKAEKGWWQAKTSGVAHIKRVRIYNRLDCCSNRLRDFTVTVDGHKCAAYHSKVAFSVKTFDCDRVGQVIRIHNTKAVPLTLCEVQVFGKLVS